MATAPRNARPRHPARAVRQPNVESAGAPPLLARLLVVYEELNALVFCMGTGYPPGTTADFDYINRLQEQVSGCADTIEDLTRAGRLDGEALWLIYHKIVSINSQWCAERANIDWGDVANVHDGPGRLATDRKSVV